MVSYLISGANRGLGFALLERLSQDPSNILFAGARDVEKATELNALAAESHGRVNVVQLDPTSQKSVDDAIKVIEKKQGSLDVLINNAGAASGGYASATQLDLEALSANFDINVVGVARLTQAALPLLRKSDTRQIFIMSSIAGSMSTGLAFGKSLGAAYSPTKAAATMLALHYHFDLKPEGFVVKPLHPGWVKTEMGGPAAMMEIKDSIDGLVEVLAKTKPDDEFALTNYDGTAIPW